MGISGGPYIVRDSSLVVELEAADLNSFSGSTSTKWNDLTGNQNTFALYNGSTYSTNGNGSIAFDGIDDGVSGSNASVYSITGTISLEAWFYATASIGFIIGKGPSNSVANQYPGNYELQMNANNVLSFLHQTTTGVLQSSYAYYNSGTNVFAINTWTHVVATCDGSSSTIYTNGIARTTTRAVAGTDGGLISTNTQTLKIGRRTDGLVMGGNIATARIYNKILSANEVLQNYEAQKSRFELSTVPATITTSTTTTTTTAAPTTTTTTTAALYSVTVRVGNSATRTVGGISSIVYKLGLGGTKTTLASGITGPDCPTTALAGTISNIPAGTVLYIGAQIGGTTDQRFGGTTGTSCSGAPNTYCGFDTTPYTITVNSNTTITLDLLVSGGAYVTC